MAFADFFQTGLATIRGIAGSQVTYKRGAQQVALSATVGTTQITFVAADGTQVQVQSRDYLLAAADLVLGSVAVLPRPGDLIVEVIAGQTCTHQVLDMKGEPSYRFSDAGRTSLRIHTKQIGVS
ncbi:hypothetical protein BH11PLA2_BH11PLA2_34570 [soil metagenome]